MTTVNTQTRSVRDDACSSVSRGPSLRELVDLHLMRAVFEYFGTNIAGLLRHAPLTVTVDSDGGVFCVVDAERGANAPTVNVLPPYADMVVVIDNPEGPGAVFKWYPCHAAVDLVFDADMQLTDFHNICVQDSRSAAHLLTFLSGPVGKPLKRHSWPLGMTSRLSAAIEAAVRS